MRSIFILALLASTVACAKEKREFCYQLDTELDTGFARCETGEVVCYVSKAGQHCWPKPPAPPADTKKSVEKVDAQAKPKVDLKKAK